MNPSMAGLLLFPLSMPHVEKNNPLSSSLTAYMILKSPFLTLFRLAAPPTACKSRVTLEFL